jgi:hypothetical protein
MHKELTVEYVKEPYWDFPGDTEEKHKKLRSLLVSRSGF